MEYLTDERSNRYEDNELDSIADYDDDSITATTKSSTTTFSSSRRPNVYTYKRAESTTSTYSSRKEKFRKQQKDFFTKTVKSFCIFLSVVGIVCLSTQTDPANSFNPLSLTSGRSLREPQRLHLIRELLLSVSDPELLDESLSPQHKALRWLSEDDQLKLPVPTNELERQKLLQRYALACLYFSTNGHNWIYNSNFLSKLDECQWNEIDENQYFNGAGVCGPDGSVTMVALWGNQLEGEIPEELSLLSNLKTLSLNGNSLYGTVPKELYNLTKLESFYLHGNEFTGDIDFMCSHNITDFRSDCNRTDAALSCTCCDVCCNANGDCRETVM